MIVSYNGDTKLYEIDAEGGMEIEDALQLIHSCYPDWSHRTILSLLVQVQAQRKVLTIRDN